MQSSPHVLTSIPADQDGFEQLARLLKAAGDPLRLEILRSLSHDSFGVMELCHLFGIRQPAMSHHLKVLAEAGLVNRRREGTRIYYRRAMQSELVGQEALLSTLFAEIDALQPNPEVVDAIHSIQAERAQSSRDFFAANASKFIEQQELIAPREQYQEQLALVIAQCTGGSGSALELGPGEGWLLPVLAEHFTTVTGVDNSPEMLHQAARHCSALDASRLQLVTGDNRDAAALGANKRLVVANMVLHHTPSPAAVMSDLARCLEPGGSLLVNELCSHDQAWVREACGDLWLGFDPEELSTWASTAGLEDGESIYLALRNGFRVQMRQFHSNTTNRD